jgi:hypothetical protein
MRLQRAQKFLTYMNPRPVATSGCMHPQAISDARFVGQLDRPQRDQGGTKESAKHYGADLCGTEPERAQVSWQKHADSSVG